MSFPRYQDYVESDVQWLGLIPSHWSIKRLKQVCLVFPSNVDKKSYEDEIPVELCNYTDVYYNERIVAGMEFMKATATQDQIDKFTLRSGDTIITKDSETAEDIGISAFVPEDIPGVICGYHLSMIRPNKETVGNYIKYFFISHFAKSKLAISANGLTRVGLSQYSIDNLEVPYPPYLEQICIANFLDDETEKIDALIAEQNKLIEQLTEKRQVLISNAVTKGLNSSVEMKQSGIDWIGEIPSHWNIRRLKFLAKIQTGDKDTENAKEDGLYPFFVRSQTIEKIDSFTHDCEAILTAGDGAGVGKVFHYYKGPFDFHQRVYMLNDFKNVTGKYLLHYFKENFFKVALGGGAKSTVDSLRRPMLTNFPVAFPDIPEQESIVRVVEQKASEFDQLILEARKATELLQERRSALISAAVTGQIDVRNYQPKEAA